MKLLKFRRQAGTKFRGPALLTHPRRRPVMLIFLALLAAFFVFGGIPAARSSFALERVVRAGYSNYYHYGRGVLIVCGAVLMLYWCGIHLGILLRLRPATRMVATSEGVTVIGPAGRRKLVGKNASMTTGGPWGPASVYYVRVKGSRGIYHLRVLDSFDPATLQECQHWLDAPHAVDN